MNSECDSDEYCCRKKKPTLLNLGDNCAESCIGKNCDTGDDCGEPNVGYVVFRTNAWTVVVLVVLRTRIAIPLHWTSMFVARRRFLSTKLSVAMIVLVGKLVTRMTLRCRKRRMLSFEQMR
jgi:hypothetical protein